MVIDSLLKQAQNFLILAEDSAKQLQEKYDLKQTILESDPKDLEAYLDYQKDYHRKYRDMLKEKDIDLYLTRQKEKHLKESKKVKSLKKTGTLESLIYILSNQIATKKYELKNNSRLNSFLLTGNKLYDFIKKLNNLIDGAPETIKYIGVLVDELKLLYNEVEYRAIKRTLSIIENKLHEIFDSYKTI